MSLLLECWKSQPFLREIATIKSNGDVLLNGSCVYLDETLKWSLERTVVLQ